MPVSLADVDARIEQTRLMRDEADNDEAREVASVRLDYLLDLRLETSHE